MGLGPVKTEGKPACCSSSNSRNLYKLGVPDAAIPCRHPGSGVQLATRQLLQHCGQYTGRKRRLGADVLAGKICGWFQGLRGRAVVQPKLFNIKFIFSVQIYCVNERTLTRISSHNGLVEFLETSELFKCSSLCVVKCSCCLF